MVLGIFAAARAMSQADGITCTGRKYGDLPLAHEASESAAADRMHRAGARVCLPGYAPAHAHAPHAGERAAAHASCPMPQRVSPAGLTLQREWMMQRRARFGCRNVCWNPGAQNA